MKIEEIIYNAKTCEITKREREQTNQEVLIFEKESKERRIQELKNNLTATDYQAIKYAEGALTEGEYTETKAQRQAWRDEINRLEKEIK